MERGYGHLKDRKLIRFQPRLGIGRFAYQTSAANTAAGAAKDKLARDRRGCFLSIDGGVATIP
jgi:hypothetical protein